ncbi:MAG: UDP-2,3-diacylglucosamine diphosphatase LpxI [Alistipes sp.]|jgi:DUF1009 family protein|nr:UDP-2,3-diacylglucosamine diphosphatase LpxI [Alistipes sp.]
MDRRKIGLLAGGGMMPVEIIRSCRARGIEVYVVGLLPWADETVTPDGTSHVMARLGEVGKMMKFFRTHDVTDIVLAGGIKRPALKELIPDFEAIKMLAKIALKKQSDDSLFRSVINEIESRGFHVLGIEEVVPEMLFHSGVYGRVKPSSDDMDDIRRGIEVARALGQVDVGQAVVVQEGIVLAVEAVEGTDAMLSRAASLRKPGKSPVMVKIKKPGQDSRVDMPAMGLQTIEQLVRHEIGGIAVEAGGILVIEREAVIAAADAAKLFIVGMDL